MGDGPRDYRCKCGKRSVLASSRPYDCEGCDTCGTTLTITGRNTELVAPHVFVRRFNEITGEPYQICERCGKTNPMSPQTIEYVARYLYNINPHVSLLYPFDTLATNNQQSWRDRAEKFLDSINRGAGSR